VNYELKTRGRSLASARSPDPRQVNSKFKIQHS
jgi:hypothetical protein